MFKLFKKKSEKEKLEAQYEKLMNESYVLSKVNRKQSDIKRAKAEAIARKIDDIEDRLS